ncbi:MAG: mechanosensitive ion channel family protein [Thermomicrobiales bacterium]
MDPTAIWEGIKTALGLDAPQAGQTVTKAIQVLLVALLTAWIAHLVSGWIARAAKTGRLYAEVAALLSRAAVLGIFAAGITVILAVLGASWTAIAAILGAATFGISLALQDVGRSFVNGIYILVERPFRIGDRVRIGEAEGRVEDVGIRLTTLRTTTGDRIIVPNTVAFSSVIENASIGRMDHQKYALDGVALPIPDIETAVIQALKGTPHLSHRAPMVEIVKSSPEGTTVQVTVEHDLDYRLDDQVIARLRTLFPEATVATTRTPAS